MQGVKEGHEDTCIKTRKKIGKNPIHLLCWRIIMDQKGDNVFEDKEEIIQRKKRIGKGKEEKNWEREGGKELGKGRRKKGSPAAGSFG